MTEKGIFGLSIEPSPFLTEERVMRVMDELFKKRPVQGFNDMVNAISIGDRMDAAAIVFSIPFAIAMEQRGYTKRYEQELLYSGETRQNCVGFERAVEQE